MALIRYCIYSILCSILFYDQDVDMTLMVRGRSSLRGERGRRKKRLASMFVYVKTLVEKVVWMKCYTQNI